MRTQTMSGFARERRLVVEPQVRHDARAEVVDDDVGAAREPRARASSAARVGQVEHDAPLAAHQRAREPAAAIAEVERVLALDLDHVGARSARMRVVTGPATTQVKSSTRMPASGRIGRRRPPAPRPRRQLARTPRRCARRARAAARPARARRRGETARPGSGIVAPSVRVLDRHEEAARGEVRVVEQRFGRAHRRVRDAAELRALVAARRRCSAPPSASSTSNSCSACCLPVRRSRPTSGSARSAPMPSAFIHSKSDVQSPSVQCITQPSRQRPTRK